MTNEIVVAIIGAAVAIVTAIIAGQYANNRGARILRRIEVYAKYKDAIKDGCLLARQEEAIEKEIYSFTGNEMFTWKVVLGMGAAIIGIVVALWQMQTAPDNLSWATLAVITMLCIVVFLFLVVLYAVPNLVGQIRDGAYKEYIDGLGPQEGKSSKKKKQPRVRED